MHVYTKICIFLDTCVGQRLMSPVFLDGSVANKLRQGLLLEPYLKDLARLVGPFSLGVLFLPPEC